MRAARLASPSSAQAILLPLLPPPPVPYRGTAEVDEDEGGHELEALTKPSPAMEGGRSAVASGAFAAMSKRLLGRPGPAVQHREGVMTPPSSPMRDVCHPLLSPPRTFKHGFRATRWTHTFGHNAQARWAARTALACAGQRYRRPDQQRRSRLAHVSGYEAAGGGPTATLRRR